jgi:hypothetical protein
MIKVIVLALEFPNLSTRNATLTIVKVASQAEKAKCVL